MITVLEVSGVANMHEFSLAQGIYDIAVEAADKHSLGEISEVRIDAGTAAGVNTEALQFAWNYLRGTNNKLKQSKLVIAIIKAEGNCDSCGFAGALNDIFRICPSCGTGGFRLSSGTEFIVTGISGD